MLHNGSRLKRVKRGDWTYYYIEEYTYKRSIVNRKHKGRAKLSNVLELGKLEDLFYVVRVFFFAEGITLPDGYALPVISFIKLCEDPWKDLRVKRLLACALAKPFKRVVPKTEEEIRALKLALFIVLKEIRDQFGDIKAKGYLPSLDPKDVLRDFKRRKEYRLKVYSDGRLTLPAEARRALGVTKEGYVEAIVKPGVVKLTHTPVEILTGKEYLDRVQRLS